MGEGMKSSDNSNICINTYIQKISKVKIAMKKKKSCGWVLI